METGRTEDGGFAVRDHAGAQWQEVDEITYQTAQQGRGERAARSFGANVVDTAAMVSNFTPAGVNRMIQDRITGRDTDHLGGFAQANDPGQAARARIDPVMETAGFVGEMLLPLPKAGAIGRTFSPVTKRFTDTAQEVVGRSMRRSDDINAARVANPDTAQTEPILRGFATTDELDVLAKDLDLDRLYTPGDRLALGARSTDDMAKADAAREGEELLKSDIFADRVAGRGKSINAIRSEGEEATTRLVARELGASTNSRLTKTTLRELRKDIVAPFDDAAKEAGDLQFDASTRAQLDDIVSEAVADDSSLVGKTVENLQKDLDSGGKLSYEKASRYRTDLGKKISNAAQAGQFTRAQSLGEIQDVLDDIVENQISGSTLEALADARYQYRILKALERSQATTNAGGQINAKSFTNALLRRDPDGRSLSRAGKGKGSEFLKNLETLGYLTEKTVPSSGTAQRMMAKATKGAGTAAGAGILGWTLGD